MTHRRAIEASIRLHNPTHLANALRESGLECETYKAEGRIQGVYIPENEGSYVLRPSGKGWMYVSKRDGGPREMLGDDDLIEECMTLLRRCNDDRPCPALYEHLA